MDLFEDDGLFLWIINLTVIVTYLLIMLIIVVFYYVPKFILTKIGELLVNIRSP